MSPSATWFLLQQEGFLTQACLCNGLTELRHANIGENKGLFYSAWFELSIGFERLMKVVLILDHMASNNLTPPQFGYIKRHEHDLMSLFTEMRNVCSRRGLTSLDSFNPDSVAVQILDFLARFADPEGRYANINKLTGRGKTSIDPLAQWGVLAGKILQQGATKGQRERLRAAQQRAKKTALRIPLASFLDDLDQRPLGAAEVLARAPELDMAAAHAVFELVRLIAALREVLEAVTDSARRVGAASSREDVPEMKEFLEFAWSNKGYVMRKKRWP